MLISELIKELQRTLHKEGDMEVYVDIRPEDVEEDKAWKPERIIIEDGIGNTHLKDDGNKIIVLS